MSAIDEAIAILNVFAHRLLDGILYGIIQGARYSIVLMFLLAIIKNGFKWLSAMGL